MVECGGHALHGCLEIFPKEKIYHTNGIGIFFDGSNLFACDHIIVPLHKGCTCEVFPPSIQAVHLTTSVKIVHSKALIEFVPLNLVMIVH